MRRGKEGKTEGSPPQRSRGGPSGLHGPPLQACPVLTTDSQDSGHSGSADRPGSVDQTGPEPCHARRERHALGLPAVAPNAVGAAAARLHAAAHVGAPDLLAGPAGWWQLLAPPGHAALHPQGPHLSGQHCGPSAHRGYVPCRELWRREHGELPLGWNGKRGVGSGSHSLQ